MIVPVEGVTPDPLVDEYSAQRGGGRPRGALDIPAPVGTPVLATHPHFEVSRTDHPEQYRGGTPTNPYAILLPRFRP